MLGKLPLSSSLSPSTMVCDGNFFLRNITPPEIFQFSSEAVLNQMANIEKELRLSDEAGENGGNNEWGNWL